VAGETFSRHGEAYGVFHFRASRSGSLVQIIEGDLGLSQQQIVDLLQLGAVYVGSDREWSEARMVYKGELIRVHKNPRRFNLNGLDFKAMLIYSCDDFVVVNKPAGLPVHAIVDNGRENLLDGLVRELGTPLHITSRLDIATSGLLIYAKNKEFQRQFNQWLTTGQVKKSYRAEVAKWLAPATYVHFMEPSTVAPKRVQLEPQADWLRCELRVTSCKEVAAGRFQLEIDLITGRTQQIRAQLASLGSPIRGDIRYGGESLKTKNFEEEPREAIELVCSRLEFPPHYVFQLPLIS
jgi:23S rRNA-/tRNA-specific pseudouridylate synthase